MFHATPDSLDLSDATPTLIETLIETPTEPAPEAPAVVEDPATGFAALGLDPVILKTLVALGHVEPTPIQREAIPVALSGRDLIGLAATGTGKTAAFALPILHDLVKHGRGTLSTLILVPTRELCAQVSEAILKYGTGLNPSIVTIYGGSSYEKQISRLRRGAEIAVATPGRALDLIRRGELKLGTVRRFVLDEADEMLDMGFADDLETIAKGLPDQRQTLLFSATMPQAIENLASRYLREPKRVAVARDKPAADAPAQVRFAAYVVERMHKPALLARLLALEDSPSALVFCRTRTEVEELTEGLTRRGLKPLALHGGLAQEQRERVMGRFRQGTTPILIATDIAARGLDVDTLSLVVNYDVPPSAEVYTHRIGRTGRAGRTGTALTLAEPRQVGGLRNLERATGRPLPIEPIPSADGVRQKRMASAVTTLVDSRDLPPDSPELAKIAELVASGVDPIALAAKLLRNSLAVGAPDIASEQIPERTRNARLMSHERGGERTPGRFGQRDNFGGDRGRPSLRGVAMTSLVIGAGTEAGIRPQDLVGAIANEAGLSGRDIGRITVGLTSSTVEVPSEAADYVVETLAETRIKGRKVSVRKGWSGPAGPAAGGPPRRR